MASSRYALKKNKNGTGTIKLVFNFGKQTKFEYYTPYKISDHKKWNTKNSEVHLSSDIDDAMDINLKLGKLKTEADKLISRHINEGIELTKEIIKSKMESVVNEREVTEKEIVTKTKNQDFVKYFEWFLKFYEQNPRPKSNKPYNKGTLKTLRNTKELIQRFQRNKKRLSFDDINLDFHAKMLDYMSKSNYSINYKGTVIKNIKTVMNDAFERDYHTNLDFKKAAFSKPTEEVDNIYLTEDEIRAIKDADLQQILDAPMGEYFDKGETKPTLDYIRRCRDFFCIGCYTGLRVSDLLKLSKKNIIHFDLEGEKQTAIAITTQKTSKRVEIPINSDLQSILDRYDVGFPEKVSDQKINIYIKKIAKYVGLDEIIDKTMTKEGIRETIKQPKYELISNHTGRRSFCTNAFNSGLSPSFIMRISGHTTEKSFLRYIKSSPRDVLTKIADHAFFR